MSFGYAGFYEEYYLRSSYEYAVIKYLEKNEINFTVEEKTYKLKECSYKPDFHIYDEDENLLYILEPKSERNYERDLPKIKEFEETYGIQVHVLMSKDIKQIYLNEMEISFEEISKEWIDKKETKTNSEMNGEFNPRYGIPCTDKLKADLSQKAKDIWNRPGYKEKMSEKFKTIDRSNYNYDYLKSERTIKKCEECGKEMDLTISEAEKRHFCSNKCSQIYNGRKGNAKSVALRNQHKEDIKQEIIDWADKNKELIKNCKSNKLNTITSNFDYENRTIYKSLGCKNGKEFLNKLRELIE